MSPASVLVAYLSGLVVVFGAAAGVGSLTGPAISPPTPAHTEHSEHSGPVPAEPGDDPTSHPATHSDMTGDDMTTRGYTLELFDDHPEAGRSVLTFEVWQPDGAPVTAFTPNHGKDVHLIVVRHDMTGYQHVHPEPVGTGRWTVPVDLGPGAWRVIADVVPVESGDPVAVHADLTVPGDWTPEPLPAPAADVEVDGYGVRLDGSLVAGQGRTLTFSVEKDGRPVTDLQPYLEAYGHLVALREGDLAYLHVHPADHSANYDGSTGAGTDGHGPAGPDIAFIAVAPSPDSYRLFVDFQHADVVRTAELTAIAVPGPGATSTAPSPGAAPDGHDTDPHEH